MFWTRLAALSLMVALGVLLGAGLRRAGRVRGAVAFCLGLLPGAAVLLGDAWLTGSTLHAVASTALFAGVPLAVIAGHAALRDGREPGLARAGFVLGVVQAMGLAAATFAGILTDAVAH